MTNNLICHSAKQAVAYIPATVIPTIKQTSDRLLAGIVSKTGSSFLSIAGNPPMTSLFPHPAKMIENPIRITISFLMPDLQNDESVYGYLPLRNYT